MYITMHAMHGWKVWPDFTGTQDAAQQGDLKPARRGKARIGELWTAVA
jgi:hypothetical protein